MTYKVLSIKYLGGFSILYVIRNTLYEILGFRYG